MRKIFIIFVTLSGTIFAQKDTVSILSDSIPIGRVSYIHQINLPADNGNNGLATLLFNTAKSIYIHHGTPKEGYATPFEDNFSKIVIGDPEGFPIYKLHAERKVLSKVSCHLVRGKERCIVTDTLGAIDWHIQPERKRFAQYECRRAIGIFGGREYEVWYAPDIPISSGPFKLAGLPGLILEARTTDNKIQFLFNGLEISDHVPGIIKVPSGKDIGMTQAELMQATIEFARQVEKNAQAQNHEATVTITVERDTIEILKEQ